MSESIPLKIVTWNVNSARARLVRIIEFLHRHSPDVVCLQEVKATLETFPFTEIKDAGYQSVIHGQPSYNGVAILAKEPVDEIRTGLDNEARVIAGTVHGLRVINVYVPNGRRIGTPKHAYKLRWLDTLHKFLEVERQRHKQFVLTGDFNVAFSASDVAHPDNWKDSVLCDPAALEKLNKIVRRFDLEDILRKHAPGPGVYTWWDFRTRGFDWNDGVRIDHILTTPRITDLTTNAWVDIDERDLERPSDHAPVLMRLFQTVSVPQASSHHSPDSPQLELEVS